MYLIFSKLEVGDFHVSYNIHQMYIRIQAIAATYPNYMSYYKILVFRDYLMSFVIKEKIVKEGGRNPLGEL